MKVAFISLSRFCRTMALAALAGLLLSSCGTTKGPRSYQSETFPSETPFQYYSSREPDNACEIAKRALLSQGYQIDDAKPRSIRGEKYFRPKPDEANTLTITLVCLPSSLGTVIYANALETQYEMKSKGTNAGVSVSALGSVSLPWAVDKDTLVKVGEETITAADFYKRLFDLIKSLDA
uniref:Lipoprotein n=1 Tax=Dechloromonas aromatica (strain RCB) TaxID=159087 RepID=Q47G65_DECAR